MFCILGNILYILEKMLKMLCALDNILYTLKKMLYIPGKMLYTMEKCYVPRERFDEPWENYIQQVDIRWLVYFNGVSTCIRMHTFFKI